MRASIVARVASTVALSCAVCSACHLNLKEADREALLWPDGAPRAQGNLSRDHPRLYYFLPPNERKTTTAVVIASGGSYGHHGGLTGEGLKVARWLVSHGITAVVLRYRVGGAGRYNHVDFIADGERAVRTVRAEAGELGIDPDRIGMFGFSAGGHLASAIATGCPEDEPASDAADPVERESCRIAFAVVVYPVITLDERYAHRRSKRNILGGVNSPSDTLLAQLSTDTQVTWKTPPVLLVHSKLDHKVDPQNSVLFHDALVRVGGSATLWLFEDGGHGVGLADDPRRMPEMSTWPERSLDWLQQIGALGDR